MSEALGRHVLFLDQVGYVGGAQVVLIEMVACALDWGWRVTVAVPLGGELEARLRGDFGNRIALEHLEVPVVSDGRKHPADLWRLFRSMLAMPLPTVAASADVVHVNGPRLYGPWRQANRRLRRPSVYHLHLRHRGLERAFIERVVARDPLGLLVASSAEAGAGLLGVDRAKVALLRNALPRTVTALPFEDRWSSAQPRWAVVGELSPLKGQDIAVAAARRLPEAELVLIGSAREANRRWAEELRAGAPTNVRFLGQVADVPGTLRAEGVQAVALPSRRAESLSMAALEAMASSCLTLYASTAAMDDVVQAVGAPRFSDAAGLAAALGSAWADPSQAAADARRQHAAVHATFSSARFASELRQRYEAVVTLASGA